MRRGNKGGFNLQDLFNKYAGINSNFHMLFLIFIVLILFIFLNMGSGLSQQVSSIAFSINSNIIYAVDVMASNLDSAKKYIDEKLYKNEIRNLRKQILLLKQQRILDHAQIEENKYLKSLLNYEDGAKKKFLTTKIISSSLNLKAGNFLIPVGINNGVNLQSYVTSEFGLGGKIIEVGENFSKVSIITETGHNTPILFATSRERAVVSGQGIKNKELYIKFSSKISNSMLGEVAVTTGDGGMYPYGLLVGTVEKTDSGNIVLSPFFTIEDLEFVQVYY